MDGICFGLSDDMTISSKLMTKVILTKKMLMFWKHKDAKNWSFSILQAQFDVMLREVTNPVLIVAKSFEIKKYC